MSMLVLKIVYVWNVTLWADHFWNSYLAGLHPYVTNEFRNYTMHNVLLQGSKKNFGVW